MRAGLLTEHITFLEPRVEKTETGSEHTTYVAVHDCRARMTYSGGDRENENGDMFWSHRVNFEVRQGLSYTETWRIEWRGRQYRILCIEDDRHNQSQKYITELIND